MAGLLPSKKAKRDKALNETSIAWTHKVTQRCLHVIFVTEKVNFTMNNTKQEQFSQMENYQTKNKKPKT